MSDQMPTTRNGSIRRKRLGIKWPRTARVLVLADDAGGDVLAVHVAPDVARLRLHSMRHCWEPSLAVSVPLRTDTARRPSAGTVHGGLVAPHVLHPHWHLRQGTVDRARLCLQHLALRRRLSNPRLCSRCTEHA